jgi:hypothetical protein
MTTTKKSSTSAKTIAGYEKTLAKHGPDFRVCLSECQTLKPSSICGKMAAYQWHAKHTTGKRDPEIAAVIRQLNTKVTAVAEGVPVPTPKVETPRTPTPEPDAPKPGASVLEKAPIIQESGIVNQSIAIFRLRIQLAAQMEALIATKDELCEEIEKLYS